MVLPDTEAAERGWRRPRALCALKGNQVPDSGSCGDTEAAAPPAAPAPSCLRSANQGTLRGSPSCHGPPFPGHASRPEPRFPRVRVLGAWCAPRRCAKEGETLPVGTRTHRECGSCYHSPFSRRRWGAAPGLQGITALFTSTPLWPPRTLPGSSQTRYKGGKRQVGGAGREAEVRERLPVVLPTRFPLRLLAAPGGQGSGGPRG